MERSQWKHKASKTKDSSDILKLKSQKNVIVKLDREVKINYFVNVETGKNFRYFFQIFIDSFSINMIQNDSHREKWSISWLRMIKYLKPLMSIFIKLRTPLTLSPSAPDLSEASNISQLIQKFEKHPSINKIKQDFSFKSNFNLNLWITMNELRNVKKHIPNDRANGWEWYIYQYCKTVWFYHHIILSKGVY